MRGSSILLVGLGRLEFFDSICCDEMDGTSDAMTFKPMMFSESSLTWSAVSKNGFVHGHSSEGLLR